MPVRYLRGVDKPGVIAGIPRAHCPRPRVAQHHAGNSVRVSLRKPEAQGAAPFVQDERYAAHIQPQEELLQNPGLSAGSVRKSLRTRASGEPVADEVGRNDAIAVCDALLDNLSKQSGPGSTSVYQNQRLRGILRAFVQKVHHPHCCLETLMSIGVECRIHVEARMPLRRAWMCLRAGCGPQEEQQSPKHP